MSADRVLITLMAAFAGLGALDRIFGNRFGIGQEFENGIQAMGSLALAMVGIVCLAPVLATVLRPVVVPVFRFLGADPAMFAGSILACDMGGGPLARELTTDPQAAALGGVITGSMLGATIVFTIPVALGFCGRRTGPPWLREFSAASSPFPWGFWWAGLRRDFPFSWCCATWCPLCCWRR